MKSKQASDKTTHKEQPVCTVCGKPRASMVPMALVRPGIVEEIRKEYPEVPLQGYICSEDLNRFRFRYVQGLLESEKGELSSLDRDVLASMREHELIAGDAGVQPEDARTFGEELSDRLAKFGGSWLFISSFVAVLLVWVVINSVALMNRPFDPYPFILLNLILSCLAALQAPIIMMSQNRQEDKDRQRAEYDYRINLKAELEIRQLHEKIDHLLSQQWQRLVEIQQIQMELMAEMKGHSRRSNG